MRLQRLILALAAALAGAPDTARSAQPAYELIMRSLAPADTDIFVAAGHGGGARPVASHPALDYNASLSPDGRWIVFTSHRSGSADIYRVRPEGSGLERLTRHAAFEDQGSLSPDGRRLAFVSTRSGQADIWVLDRATGAVRNLTAHAAGDFRPAWSPDGRWIAFSSDRHPPRGACPDTTAPGPGPFVTPQYTAVYIMRADGSGLRRVSGANVSAASPQWSADGLRLAFHAVDIDSVCRGSLMLGRGPSQIVVADVAAKGGKNVTSGDGLKLFPRWRDRGEIVYVTDRGLGFTSAAPPVAGEFGRPSWSPDGRAMVFHREVDPRPDRDRDFLAWPSRDPRFRLLRVPGHASVSPGGDRLVYLSTNFQGVERNGVLITASLDGSGRKPIYEGPLTDDLSGPAWSPAGDRILFGLGGFFQRAGIRTARLMSVRPDGSSLAPVTSGETNDAMPSWSPDGRQVVMRVVRARTRGLEVLDLASGARRRLVTGSDYDTFPAWSPRGDWIVFTSKRDGDYEIYRVRPDGSGLRRLTRAPGVDAHPSVSPDGQWIAFATGRQGFKDESTALVLGAAPPPFQPYGEIAVMRIDGTDVRILTDNSVEEGTPVWTPRSGRR